MNEWQKGVVVSVYMGWDVVSFQFKLWCGQILGVRLAERGARTPSEYCRVTLMQGTKPRNALIGLCDKLVTQRFTLLSCRYCWAQHPPWDPKRDKVVKKRRKYKKGNYKIGLHIMPLNYNHETQEIKQLSFSCCRKHILSESSGKSAQ